MSGAVDEVTDDVCASVVTEDVCSGFPSVSSVEGSDMWSGECGACTLGG